MHPTIIDIGTDDDAGFWLAALPFVHFQIGEHAPDDVAELLTSSASVFAPFHDNGVSQ